jgi:hypothetical protein
MPLFDQGRSKLIVSLLLPSWLSGIFALIIGLVIFWGPFLLIHYGTTAQQGFIGLNSAYQQSSLSVIEHNVSSHFLGSQLLSSVIFLAFWGAVGLVVYLLAYNTVRRAGDIFSLVKQLGYVHVVRHQLIQYHLRRGLLRILAVGAWCLLLPFLVYRLVPFSIAAAHASAMSGSLASNWLLSLLFCLCCILAIHVLIVLLRLMVLRTRLFGSSLAVYHE